MILIILIPPSPLGFNLVKEVLGNEGFNKQGAPITFMTDNDDAIRNALAIVWPSARRLLCTFHISQQVFLELTLGVVNSGMNNIIPALSSQG